jgi:hypothetical protein
MAVVEGRLFHPDARSLHVIPTHVDVSDVSRETVTGVSDLPNAASHEH